MMLTFLEKKSKFHFEKQIPKCLIGPCLYLCSVSFNRWALRIDFMWLFKGHSMGLVLTWENPDPWIGLVKMIYLAIEPSVSRLDPN